MKPRHWLNDQRLSAYVDKTVREETRRRFREMVWPGSEYMNKKTVLSSDSFTVPRYYGASLVIVTPCYSTSLL